MLSLKARIESYSEQMLRRAIARIEAYDTMNENKNDLQLWLDAKLLVNEVKLLTAEIEKEKINNVIN